MSIYELLSEIKTKNGNLVELYGKSKNYEYTTLIVGGFHGDEPDGVRIIKKYLQNGDNSNLLFIPCLNPDGALLNTRQNACRVDLNRNFPTKNWIKSDIENEYFGGYQPKSEIETQFIMKVINDFSPKKILTIHSPYGVVNYDGDSVAFELATNISKIIGYKVSIDIGYPTPGSFGTYYGKERNIPTVTLELAENINFCEEFSKIKTIFDSL